MLKNWCFWTVVLEKTLAPWTARSNQSILKEFSPEYSLEGLMLKLKLQYFGYLMQSTDSLKKTLMLGKIEGGRRRGQQRMRWLDGITDSMDMSLSKLRNPVVLESMGSQRVGHNWVTELNWTEAIGFISCGLALHLHWLATFLSRRFTLVLVIHNTLRIDVQPATDGQMAHFENYMIHTKNICFHGFP